MRTAWRPTLRLCLAGGALAFAACAEPPAADAVETGAGAAAEAAAPQDTVSPLLAEGIRAFRAGDWAAAMDAFERAELDTPDDPHVYRWMGIVSVASGEDRESYYWINKIGLPGGMDALYRSRLLMGLRYWQQGDRKNAAYWLKEASPSAESPVYEPARAAMKAMAQSAPAPAVGEWPALAGLKGAAIGAAGEGAVAVAPAAGGPVTIPPASSRPVEPAPAAGGAVPVLSGPSYRIGGKVAPGRYVCRDLDGEQMKGLSELGSVGSSSIRIRNQFEVTGAGRYAYLGSAPQPGDFRYDAKSGAITFTSGPYSSEPGEESTITGVYGTRRENDLPIIILLFRDPAYGETYEYCVNPPK